MKKWFLIIALVAAPLFSQAQMKAQWHNGRGKYVCAAYGYGKFSGPTGKSPKFVRKSGGRKTVRGRSYRSMLRHANRLQQRGNRIFNPH